MQAYRVETTLTEDGALTLRDIPFRKGDSVKIIVLPLAAAGTPDARYPLRGTPVVFHSPAESVAEANWEAAG